MNKNEYSIKVFINNRWKNFCGWYINENGKDDIRTDGRKTHIVIFSNKTKYTVGDAYYWALHEAEIIKNVLHHKTKVI